MARKDILQGAHENYQPPALYHPNPFRFTAVTTAEKGGKEKNPAKPPLIDSLFGAASILWETFGGCCRTKCLYVCR